MPERNNVWVIFTDNHPTDVVAQREANDTLPNETAVEYAPLAEIERLKEDNTQLDEERLLNLKRAEAAEAETTRPMPDQPTLYEARLAEATGDAYHILHRELELKLGKLRRDLSALIREELSCAYARGVSDGYGQAREGEPPPPPPQD